jgi:hypothetical protein
MFTDRVCEQELLTRLLAPSHEGGSIDPKDFLTTFYGVGGVGKTTLCNKVAITSQEKYPGIKIVSLNLDSPEYWTIHTSFSQLLAALLHELNSRKVSCPLTQTLLLMYCQANNNAGQERTTAGLWSAALSALDQATQAVGIPGIGLAIQGAQWLRDRQRQADIRKSLDKLNLWPKAGDGKIDLLDLERNLAKALYEDLKKWASQKMSLRIIFDGFERIQGRERRQDCQMLLQNFAGYIAESKNPELYAQIRIFIFSRDMLRWDEIYNDDGWRKYWTQHLLEGLGEDDAKEFLGKHADWLQSHGYPTHADLINKSIDPILDAADEHVGNSRLIYPYYLDLAITIIRQAAYTGRKPDLGKTPGELQDRFFRDLPQQELRLLKILAMAERFDAIMFDELIRTDRVAGYAVGTFLTAVTNGRSYITKNEAGKHRFHRLMETALQDLWMKSDDDKEEGREMVRWLVTHLADRVGTKRGSEWGEPEITSWEHGVSIILNQGPLRKLLDFSEWRRILQNPCWQFNDYTPFEHRLFFQEKVTNAVMDFLGSNDPETIESKILNIEYKRANSKKLNIYMDSIEYGKYIVVELKALVEIATINLGDKHQSTLSAKHTLANSLKDIQEYEESEEIFYEISRIYRIMLGIENAITICCLHDYATLMIEKRHYGHAQNILDEISLISLKTTGNSSIQTNVIKATHGILCAEAGRPHKAVTYFVEAADELAKTCGPNHPHTTQTIRNLHRSILCTSPYDLLDLCDIISIEAILEAILISKEKQYGMDSMESVSTLRHLSVIFSETGRINRAINLCRRELAIIETLGDDASKMTSLRLLSDLLIKNGDYEEAERLKYRELNHSESYWGAEHEKTLNRVNNLGCLLYNKGDYEGAEVLYRRALAGYEKSLGAGHPDTMDLAFDLSCILNELGRRNEAISLLRRFATMSEIAHHAIAYNLACYECLEGNHAEATRLISEHIKLHPENKAQALADEDFAAIRDWIEAL